MKFLIIFIAFFWLVSYMIVTIKIVKSKERIPLLSILFMFLLPFVWIFFIKYANRIEDMLQSKKLN